MTKEEFLLDTLEYFTADVNRRCIDNKGICVYSKTGKSEGCAIGRHLSAEATKKFDSVEDPLIEFIMANDELLSMMPEWMRGLDREFLGDVQKLHDGSCYFSLRGTGLSHSGRCKVHEIIRNYEMDETVFEKYLTVNA